MPGMDIYDSKSIFDALVSSSPIRSTNYHTYSPIRETILGTNLKRLNQYYKIQRCEGKLEHDVTSFLKRLILKPSSCFRRYYAI